MAEVSKTKRRKQVVLSHQLWLPSLAFLRHAVLVHGRRAESLLGAPVLRVRYLGGGGVTKAAARDPARGSASRLRVGPPQYILDSCAIIHPLKKLRIVVVVVSIRYI